VRYSGICLLVCLTLAAACSPRGVGLDADSTESRVEMEVDGVMLKGELTPGEYTDSSGKSLPAMFFTYPCRAGADASAEALVIALRLNKRLEKQQAAWFSVTCYQPAEGAGGRRVSITEFVRENGEWQSQPTRQSIEW